MRLLRRAAEDPAQEENRRLGCNGTGMRNGLAEGFDFSPLGPAPDLEAPYPERTERQGHRRF